jgi:glutaredoxin
MRMMTAVLFTRQGCPLCEEAHATLRRHGIEPEVRDISEYTASARKPDCAPVLVLNGRERFRGRINEVLLRRVIRNEAARP